MSVQRKFTYHQYNPVDNNSIKDALITPGACKKSDRFNFTHFTHSFHFKKLRLPTVNKPY
jgi:hypothetical protein